MEIKGDEEGLREMAVVVAAVRSDNDCDHSGMAVLEVRIWCSSGDCGGKWCCSGGSEGCMVMVGCY